jgi:hypothetical protein
LDLRSGSLEIIARQPYIKVTREIEFNQQNYMEEEKVLVLYENVVVSSSHTFTLQDVFDISYKKVSDHDGFLYLHTNQGLFSFYTKADPANFIDQYKKLK